MDLILALKALIMGVVEGLTEFLPISSTGHLILAGSILDFTSDTFTLEKRQIFEIAIQPGAIFAVCWEYRARLTGAFKGLFSDAAAQKFVLNVAIAFLPFALLGFLFGKYIKAVLFKPAPVAIAFIVGGLIILWVERRNKTSAVPVRIDSVDQMSPLDALKIGCAQVFALIPGTSRSGATIIGGMLFGFSRKAATEFSFFLAVPTLLIATIYSLYKDRALLTAADAPLFVIGAVAAFVSAFLCVRWLLRYISSHDFTAFAWYRIAFGIVVLASAHFGWLVWVD